MNLKSQLFKKHPDLFYFLMSYLFIQKRLYRRTIKPYCKRLGGRLLDVGCGRQPYKNLIPFDVYVGMEYTASQAPDIVGDARKIPFQSEIFDSILCTEVLEHVNEPKQVIQEINRVLKLHGKLLLSAPMSWNLHYEPNDYYRFTKYGLIYLLENHGFQILAINRVGGAFSLAGARITNAFHSFWHRKLRWVPSKLRVALIQLLVCIPLSIGFYVLARIFDRIDQTDAINWIILAEKTKSIWTTE